MNLGRNIGSDIMDETLYAVPIFVSNTEDDRQLYWVPWVSIRQCTRVIYTNIELNEFRSKYKFQRK